MADRLIRAVLALAVLALTALAGGEARALDPDRSVAQFLHTAWTPHDGVPAYVTSLTQTPDGYLWIGSMLGLYRFDGVRAEAVAPGVVVTALAVTTSGDLWVGTSAGVARLEAGRLARVEVPGLDAGYAVRLMATGPHGDLWLATDSQVARFDGRGWQVMQSDWGSSNAFHAPGGVWGLAVARDGVVWAKNVTSLYYLRPGSTRFLKADGYGGATINFARAADGRLWTADTTTARFYALPDLPPSGPAPPPAEFGAPLPAGVLAWALIDRDGTLWCANQVTGGVHRVRSVVGPAAPADDFEPRDGLTDPAADAVFEDREGDIWIGTLGGLDRFAPANVVTEPAISVRGQSPFVVASPAAVYVADGWPAPVQGAAHPKERIWRITDGAPQPLPIDIGAVWGLDARADGELMLVAGGRLFEWRDGTLTSMALPAPVHAGGPMSFASVGRQIWLSVDRLGMFLRSGDAWAPYAPPGIALGAPPFLDEGPDGAVWIIGQNGALVRTDGARTQALVAPGLAIGEIRAFAPDGQGGGVLGGVGGVAWFDGRGFHTLARQQAPFLVWVVGIASDDVGGTWFDTLAGVYRVPTGQLRQAFLDPKVRLDDQLFDARDGLRSLPNTDGEDTAKRGPDGRIWLLATDNVSWIDPRHLYRNLTPPPVSIESLTAQGRVLDPAAAHQLAAGVSNVQIDYTALSLQSPDRVRFRYQLEGVDRAWVDAGARRQAFYTRLGPGHYRFHVIAANNDGVWNDTGASLEFEIPPTFLQSGWFFGLCMLAAAVLLWLAYRWRLRQVTVAIQSRLEERVAERERIARELHDTLLQGFQGLVLRFQAIMERLPAGEPARAQMDAALERADEVLVSGRDRVRQLRTQGENDLAEALSAAGRSASASSDARFRLALDGAPQALHPIVAEELAAIGREAIVNAFQHAGARSIDALLAYGSRELALRIVDDGGGIDPGVLAAGGRAGHFGLTGMRERARKIQARFAVRSRPGEGCEISVTLPARLAYAAQPSGTALSRWLGAARGRLALLLGRSAHR